MEIVPKLLIVGFGKVAQGIAMALNKSVEVIGIKRNILDLKNNFNVINADIFEDDLDNILKNTNPDYVLYSIAADEQTPESYQNAYVNGLRNTLKAATIARGAAGVLPCSPRRPAGRPVQTARPGCRAARACAPAALP